ncbi:probable glutathione S-transferase 8 [Watersipora subatra]|uniref:probable glutathione S-transferase 8 n=1 Tax=Watersipora subatra TaxID=2589382 RepID=UPI00355C9863
MATKDKLVYLPLRARGEAIRMLYVVAGKKFDDTRITGDDFAAYKPKTPFGQLPVLETAEGMLCNSNVIARHVARKLGLSGKTQWEETLHDLVTECAQDCINMYALPNIYNWQVFKLVPVPENSEELLQKAKTKWTKVLEYVESLAKKRGKKYIVSNELGLADLFLFAAMEFSKTGTPDIMTLTPWAKQFTEKVAADPKLTKYLADRPEATV